MSADDDEWGDDAAAIEPLIDLSLEVAPTKDIGETGADCEVVVSIKVPDCTRRVPIHVCCVVDVSASMKTKASYEVDGELADDGLCVLDIIKHAVKSIIHMLEDQDQLALVAYNDSARTVFPLQSMTHARQSEAISALEALHPELGTNIWSGLFIGMEALRAVPNDKNVCQRSLLLLTDGRDGHQHRDRGGHVAMLRDYKETHPSFGFQINTFGFGYNLDSSLLLNLAVEGQGTFSFIPDAVIVGTCFVNCVANLLSTQTQTATLHLTANGGAELTGAVSGIQDQMVKEASWGRVISLGPLHFGQSRDVVLPMRIPAGTAPYLDVAIVWQSPDRTEGRRFAQASERVGSTHAVAALARSETVRVGFEAITEGNSLSAADGREKVLALGSRIAAYEITSQHQNTVVALKADVEGRMAKALDGQDRFKRWGMHYLRALVRAHQLQLCTNFMDTGLQVYGGSLFRSLRADGEAIFLSLPPPTQKTNQSTGSKTRQSRRGGRSRAGGETEVHQAIGSKGKGKGKETAGVNAQAKSKSKAQAKSRAQAPKASRTLETNTVPAPSVPPKPAATPNPAPPMQTYYAGCGGGCFGGASTVVISTPGDVLVTKHVADVQPGDVLQVVDGMSQVLCVVQISLPKTSSMIAFAGGLEITPRHPVRIAGMWRLPQDVPGGKLKHNHNGYVYNFVLDRCHILPVDGVECVTLGHGIQEALVGHAYYGTNRVINDLAVLPGWEKGFVQVQDTIRDAAKRATAPELFDVESARTSIAKTLRQTNIASEKYSACSIAVY